MIPVIMIGMTDDPGISCCSGSTVLSNYEL